MRWSTTTHYTSWRSVCPTPNCQVRRKRAGDGCRSESASIPCGRPTEFVHWLNTKSATAREWRRRCDMAASHLPGSEITTRIGLSVFFCIICFVLAICSTVSLWCREERPQMRHHHMPLHVSLHAETFIGSDHSKNTKSTVGVKPVTQGSTPS